MPNLTTDQDKMFTTAIDRITAYGTGEFRKDLPKALRVVATTYDEHGMLSPLHGLVLHAAAMRLDQIAKEMTPGPFPDEPTVELGSELREFRHTEGG